MNSEVASGQCYDSRLGRPYLDFRSASHFGWLADGPANYLKMPNYLKISKIKIIDELSLLYTYLSSDWAPQLLYSKKNYNYLQQNIQKIACNAKIHEFLSNWQLRFVAKTSAGGPAGDAERKSNYGRPKGWGVGG